MRLEIQNQERPYAMDLPCDYSDDLDQQALRRWAEKLEIKLSAAAADREAWNRSYHAANQERIAWQIRAEQAERCAEERLLALNEADRERMSAEARERGLRALLRKCVGVITQATGPLPLADVEAIVDAAALSPSVEPDRHQQEKQ